MSQEQQQVATVRVWERAKGETDKAFAAFNTYKGFSPFERSLVKTCESIGHKDDKTVRAWSRKFKWQMRVQSWDDYQARLDDEEAIRTRREIGLRRRQLGTLLQNKVLNKLGTLKPEEMTIKETLEMLKAGVELENEGVGLPSRTTGVVTTPANPNAGAANSMIKLYDASLDLDKV